MKTKVCHITSAHSKDDPRILHKQCVSLSKAGYSVTLIVNDKPLNEIVKGVHIISSGIKPKNRKERFLDSKKKLWQKAMEVDADIYQLHDPDLLPMGNKLKKVGKKVIFDSHEDVPQQIIDKGWIPRNLRNTISKAYESYEKYSISKYDGAISVTPKIVERLLKINSNTVMITNYPIIDENQYVERNPEKAICFAGGITNQYHHVEIIKAMESIDGIKYLLAGRVSDDYLEELKSLPAWDRVDFKGIISFDEVKEIYSKSIIGMAVHYSNQAKIEGSFGGIKLFEFMAAKLPVICTDYKINKEIIEGNNCGICVDPKNIKEIENAIRYIIDHPEEAKIMGENGRRAVLEKFNWGEQEKILLGMYERLLDD